MADPYKPTPTQDENDRTASGEHVIDHEPDGSPLDPGMPHTVEPTRAEPAPAREPAPQASPAAPVAAEDDHARRRRR